MDKLYNELKPLLKAWVRREIAKDAWREDDHPRDEDGKFTSGNSGKSEKPKKLDIRHKTQKVRDSIKNAVKKMGLSYILDDSRASDSSYITVYEPDEDGDAKGGSVLKIRVADHKLPHFYEQPDINVTTSGNFDGDDFLYAMQSIAEKFNKKLPPQVRGIITRKENEKKRKETAAKEKEANEAEARRKERESFINKNGSEILKNYENSALRPAQNSELWGKIDDAHINKSKRANGWNLTMYEQGDPRNAQKGNTIPLTYNVADVLGIDLPTNSGANSISTETENRVRNAFKALKTYADKFYSAINS